MESLSTNDTNEFSANTFNRRKKKKSFLQKARRQGKSGRFGRGSEINRETYDYFVRVLEQLNQGFEQDEDAKSIFVANVFETTLNEEVNLCSNQLVSRVIQMLLPLANKTIRNRFMQCLTDDLRIVAMDPFSSHVLETLLLLATFDKAESRDMENEELMFRQRWVVKVSKFMINNFDEFSKNMYASHLLRTCFQCLGGTRLEDNITRSRRSRDQQTNKSNTLHEQGQGHPVLGKMESQISQLPPGDEHLTQYLIMAVNKTLTSNLLEMVSVDTSSAVVQALILVLAKVSLTKECQQLCSLLIEKIFKGKTLLSGNEDVISENITEDSENILHYESCCRLLETIIVSSESLPKVFKKCKKIFEKSLYDWALHPVGNFALQKFLAKCTDKELLEKWYESIFDQNLEEILASGNAGVVLSLAQAIRRLSVKQAHFLVSIMKSLHCYEPSQHQMKIAPLLAYLSTKEAHDEGTQNADNSASLHVNLHGSLILQEMLHFSKPIKVVNSLLGMDPNELSSLLCDPRGSHITDAFMESTTIGEKSRDGLVKALQGNLVAMACSKHGSRSIDKIWAKASQKGRELLAQELAAKLSLLTSHNTGRFIVQNLFLSTFKRSKDDWRECVKNHEKQKHFAKDFLSELSSSKRQIEEKPDQVMKKAKVEIAKDNEAEPIDFVMHKSGSANNLQKVDDMQEGLNGALKKKKKKEKFKSYLDDL